MYICLYISETLNEGLGLFDKPLHIAFVFLYLTNQKLLAC